MPPAASFKKLGKLNIYTPQRKTSSRVFGGPAARWSGEFERAEGPFKKQSDDFRRQYGSIIEWLLNASGGQL